MHMHMHMHIHIHIRIHIHVHMHIDRDIRIYSLSNKRIETTNGQIQVHINRLSKQSCKTSTRNKSQRAHQLSTKVTISGV